MTKEELTLEVIRRLKVAYPLAECTLDYDQAWKLLVSVRLAAQCTDARVNIVTKDQVNEVAQDFINFILSEDGQKVVEDAGYISQGNTGAFKAAGVKGKINVAGSSSVTPVMEKLKEAYVAVNPDVQIEVQQSDSTTGVTSAIEGICDIGMASRELKDSETSEGVSATAIALDGIAVIINQNNPITDMTSEQVRSIFTGETQDWSDIK